jgi:hypothetical protein
MNASQAQPTTLEHRHARPKCMGHENVGAGYRAARS